jgi:hypothetical protein
VIVFVPAGTELLKAEIFQTAFYSKVLKSGIALLGAENL